MCCYSDICEHHHDGFCVYIGNGYGIFEKCAYVKLCDELKEEQMRGCLLRKNIERLMQKDAECNNV